MIKHALRSLTAAALVASMSLNAHADSPVWVVDDFAVTYGAKVGIARGQTRLEMRRAEDNEYVVESWTELRGIASWFKRGNIYEVARYEYVDGEVRTRRFERRDSISSEDRNVVVDYNWDDGLATVTYQGNTSLYPIEPGVSNTLVMQVELMQALSTGQRPDWLDVVGHKGRLRFDIQYDGPDALTIDSASRTLYRYSHSRRDSGIRTTFWAEPARDHLPLQARIDKGNKLKGQLTLLGDEVSAGARRSGD